MSNSDTKLREELIELFKRTIDLEDPDRQYIGFLADKCIEMFESELNKQYRQGIKDALFDPSKHSEEEISARNSRINFTKTDDNYNPKSANEKLGLPRDKMKKIKIAFDVDGTLRCNCTNDCQDANTRIVLLFKILNTFKNTELYVWSGGGAVYAWRFAQKFGLPIKESKCISKFGAPQMDIAIDDIQDTAIAKINLIVKEK